MKLRIVSDLHTEFAPCELPELPTDGQTILLLPGDIGLFKHSAFEQWMRNVCEQFYSVIHIAGNHEYYSGSLANSHKKFQIQMSDVSNYHLLNNDFVTFHDILFIGSTLWTSFRDGNPILMMEAEGAMNDYKKIRIGPSSKPWLRKIRSADTRYENIKAMDYIGATLEDEMHNYDKTVVMTHHAPSYQSVHEIYKDRTDNDLYVNNLDDFILQHQPDFWIHGHVHTSFDYMIGETRVICNPRGYPRSMFRHGDSEYDNPEFNPALMIDL